MVDVSIPEIWKPIAEHSGYEVSDIGRVRSIDRTVMTARGPWTYKGQILRQTFNKRLERFQICFGGRTKTMAVHVLVCTAFHGNAPSPKHEVAHYDGNGINNCAFNLRWATRKENCADTARHGRTHRPQGERHPKAILTASDVIEIRRLYKMKLATGVDLARRYGVATSTLYSAVNCINWSHI